jgi:chaperonin GroES
MVEKLLTYGPYVIVERAKFKEKTDSGILLPHTIDNRPRLSKIVAINNGWISKQGKFLQYDFKIGQFVYVTIEGHGGEKFMYNGKRYWKVNIEWLAVVIDGPEADKVHFISENDDEDYEIPNLKK